MQSATKLSSAVAPPCVLGDGDEAAVAGDAAERLRGDAGAVVERGGVALVERVGGEVDDDVGAVGAMIAA